VGASSSTSLPSGSIFFWSDVVDDAVAVVVAAAAARETAAQRRRDVVPFPRRRERVQQTEFRDVSNDALLRRRQAVRGVRHPGGLERELEKEAQHRGRVLRVRVRVAVVVAAVVVVVVYRHRHRLRPRAAAGCTAGGVPLDVPDQQRPYLLPRGAQQELEPRLGDALFLALGRVPDQTRGAEQSADVEVGGRATTTVRAG
jgi:hypothetical protein